MYMAQEGGNLRQSKWVTFRMAGEFPVEEDYPANHFRALKKTRLNLHVKRYYCFPV
jgi:hypothetical protein